jgi:hypothetical protein
MKKRQKQNSGEKEKESIIILEPEFEIGQVVQLNYAGEKFILSRSRKMREPFSEEALIVVNKELVSFAEAPERNFKIYCYVYEVCAASDFNKNYKELYASHLDSVN